MLTVVIAVAGEFGEHVAEAQDHRVAQQVSNDIDDAAIGHDVLDVSGVPVPVDDLVASLLSRPAAPRATDRRGSPESRRPRPTRRYR